MRLRSVANVAVLMGLLLFPHLASAQSGTAGSIAGVVKDSTGAVLPGVTVEAASPALIERVRSVATDASGEYKIVDLRPGTYSVSFTLPGFTSVKREGLELTTGFTATVNADLKVGSVTETLTVTGATPVVDTHNVRTQQLYSREVLDALPTPKSLSAYGSLIVGARLNSYADQDVGGVKGEVAGFGGFSVHGSRTGDTFVGLDGMPVDQIYGGGQNRTVFVNQLAVEETTLQTGGFTAENEFSGVNVNIVPKDGGNRFTFATAGNGTGPALQGSNLTDQLIARGLTATPGVKQIYDIGFGLGGPIIKDRLWFFTSHRWWDTQNYTPGVFYNGTPHTLVYTPDLARQAYTDLPHRDNDVRVTWQATAKQKVTASYFNQYACNCNYMVDTGLRAPDATSDNLFRPDMVTQATWTYPVTSRLLLAAGASVSYVYQQDFRNSGVLPTDIPVVELTTGFQYGAKASLGAGANVADYARNENASQTNQRFSVSYVTGSHAFKTGFYMMEGWGSPHAALNNTAYGPVLFELRNGVPAAIQEYLSPLDYAYRLNPDLGLYAQDQWTLKRLTLNLGLRYDHLREYAKSGSTQPGVFVPAVPLPAVNDVPLWNDVNPRLGAAYDVFGNGRTAIKWSMGRSVQAEFNTIVNSAGPANALATFATRTWTVPGAAPGQNFVPDCNLTNPLANGQCGQISNLGFGQSQRVTFYADNFLHGFDVRPYNWQTSVSLQQELRPGLALNVGYFNMWYGNFAVLANQAVTPADFNSYCITAPTSTRLGAASGSQICGLYDVTPAKFGQVNNLVQHAANFGKQYEHYNGVDVTVNARFAKGGLLAGGMNVGQTVTDNCGVVQGNPQIPFPVYTAFSANTLFPNSSPGANGGRASQDFCHAVLPWSGTLQFKLAGSYPLPWWDLQTSATFQSLPGLPIYANYVVPNAQIVPSLGRNLAAGPAGTVTVSLIPPFTQFEDRINQVDFRLAKTVRIGRTRVKGMFDLYNVFNNASILTENYTYGAQYLKPGAVLGARLVKLGAQIDF